jgi:hypothetical protein
MKIVNDTKKKGAIDLDLLIEEAFQKHDAVFFSEIENILFVYRPLGRKEYKDIYNNVNMSDLDKQDTICKTVLIHPVDFDFDDCDAGIPSRLYEDVMDKSCLDPESMYHLLNFNREEAEQLGSEMACIIAEAFPAYTIDEIESWNSFKFMKLYAQAEWILTNIRGVEFKLDIADYLAEIAGIEHETYIQPEEQPKQTEQPVQKKAANNPPPGKGMSAEQMKAYQDFIRQHPEFADAMQYDSAFTGMESMSADTVNPALRPGWYHNH